MKKLMRVGALLLVLILVALYGSTLYFAITDNPQTMRMFAVSIVSTVVLPVLLYVYKYIFSMFGGKTIEETDAADPSIPVPILPEEEPLEEADQPEDASE